MTITQERMAPYEHLSNRLLEQVQWFVGRKYLIQNVAAYDMQKFWNEPLLHNWGNYQYQARFQDLPNFEGKVWQTGPAKGQPMSWVDLESMRAVGKIAQREFAPPSPQAPATEHAKYLHVTLPAWYTAQHINFTANEAMKKYAQGQPLFAYERAAINLRQVATEMYTERMLIAEEKNLRHAINMFVRSAFIQRLTQPGTWAKTLLKEGVARSLDKIALYALGTKVAGPLLIAAPPIARLAYEAPKIVTGREVFYRGGWVKVHHDENVFKQAYQQAVHAYHHDRRQIAIRTATGHTQAFDFVYNEELSTKLMEALFVLQPTEDAVAAYRDIFYLKYYAQLVPTRLQRILEFIESNKK